MNANSRPILGQWWEPHAPDKKLFGVVDYGEEISLNLLDTFSVSSAFTEDIAVLHGFMQEGGDATLLSCSGGIGSGYPGCLRTELRAQLLAKGVHLNKGWDSAVRSLRCSSQLASRWFGRFGATEKVDYEAVTMTIDYRQPEPIVVPVSNGVVLTISFNPTFGAIGWDTTELNLSQQAMLSLEFTPPSCLSGAMGTTSRLEELLSLLAGWQIVLSDFEVEFEDVPLRRDPRNPSMPVRIAHLAREEKHSDQDWAYLWFGRMAARFPSVVTSWFAAHTRIEPLIRHWNVLRKARADMPLEYQVTALCSVVEAAEKLHEAVPVNPEPRLVERLEGFLRRAFPAAMVPSGVRRWAEGVRDTRHWLTHYTSKYKTKALDPIGQANACETMREALKLDLLAWCGIKAEEACTLMDPSAREHLVTAARGDIWTLVSYRGGSASSVGGST